MAYGYAITITLPFPDGDAYKRSTKVVPLIRNERIHNNKDVKWELLQVLEQLYEHEMDRIDNGYSGSRSYENIKKEKDELELEFELSKEATNRNMFEVKFVDKFNI